MKATKYGFLLCALVVLVLALASCSQPASPSPAAKLPKIVTITSNELGGTDYLWAMAIRVAVERYSPMLLRLEGLPSAKAQVEALRLGQSDFTMQTGATAFRVTQGLEDFKDWGPTPLRRVWNGKPNFYAMAARGDAGFKTVADLKGKRIGQSPASYGWSINQQASLAFGGLTLADIVAVNVSSIAAGLKGPLEGSLDAVNAAPWAPAMQELAASRYGIKWFNMPKEDKDGWERARKIIPWAGPVTDTAPGLKAGELLTGFGYEQGIWAYPSVPDDVVYAFCKAMKDGYEDLKKVSPDLKDWTVERAANLDGLLPAPFHEGAVKFLKDAGLWKAEQEQFQQEALRLAKAK